MAKSKWGEQAQTRTASETVYDILHRNIINLNLVPGTLMSEKDISEKMEVSRTPVREAFIKLSNQALVTVIPQKGSFVSRISLSRVKEERFLRESLETSVIEEIILNEEKISLDRQYRNLENQKKALDEGNTTLFIDLDDQFHASLFELAHRPMCYDVIINFSSHYRRVRYLSMSVSGVSTSNYKHHNELLQMIEKRDLETARETMKTHLRKLNIEKDIIYQKYPDYFEDESITGKGLAGFDETKLFK